MNQGPSRLVFDLPSDPERRFTASKGIKVRVGNQKVIVLHVPYVIPGHHICLCLASVETECVLVLLNDSPFYASQGFPHQ